MSKADYSELIVHKLSTSAGSLKREFSSGIDQEVRTRYFVVDDLLPEDNAREIHSVFPPESRMREMSSFREHKYTSKDFDEFNPAIRDIAVAFQNASVIKQIEEITGIDRQIADPSFYAGGLSRMGRGHFLNPHIDNSHEARRHYYRALNLLYYVTPGWRSEDGGSLELWDSRVRTKVVIPCLFNRLVVMETNPWSWHSVSPVVTDTQRCCISNYYFSPESPVGESYSHVTSFSARPDQKIRRMMSWLDNRVRSGVRMLFPFGLGKDDVYKGRRK